jgi:putative Ca2+/H+ antiporter (TMEM165/GDT1 family)
VNFYLLLASYGTVFLTELLGDKTPFTISLLTTSVRPRPLFCGMSAAFTCKMLAAVCVGQTVAQTSTPLLATFSAFSFFAAALLISFRPTKGSQASRQVPLTGAKALLAAFSAIFFVEWGDAGQLTAAALAARYQTPLTVWIGATLALMLKGLLAISLGLGLRNFLPRSALRYGALAVCLTMGIFAALRVGS